MAAFKKFLKEHGTFFLDVLPWSGDHDEQNTVETIKQQIDRGFLIPYLLLHHKNPNFENYEWHGSCSPGYDEKLGRTLSGESRDLRRLRNEAGLCQAVEHRLRPKGRTDTV